jgi:hypothetical protein
MRIVTLEVQSREKLKKRTLKTFRVMSGVRSGFHFLRPVLCRVGTAFQGSSGQGCLG